MAPREVLQTLEQQVLRLQFIEPEGVDDEDGVIDDVADRGENYEKSPAMKIRPRTGKQSIND